MAGEHVLRGNIVRISPVSLLDDIGTFSNFQVLACGVPPFTIINEIAAAAPPLALAIRQAGTNVVVSYPGFASYYSFLERAYSLNPGEPWTYDTGRPLPSIRSQTVTRFPLLLSEDTFFRLRNPYAQILGPYPD
jgi:hypothetical protein